MEMNSDDSDFDAFEDVDTFVSNVTNFLSSDSDEDDQDTTMGNTTQRHRGGQSKTQRADENNQYRDHRDRGNIWEQMRRDRLRKQQARKNSFGGKVNDMLTYIIPLFLAFGAYQINRCDNRYYFIIQYEMYRNE